MKLFLVGIFIFQFCLYAVASDSHLRARENMVEQQIAARGVKNDSVLDAMRNVDRRLFVPAKLADKAYDDRPLPIGYGQTISQPYIVAYMTEVVEPKQEYKALEIGAGSGYQAAILAETVKEVYTIEIVKELYELSSERLSKRGNVKVKHADGYHGWPEHAPFDIIVVTAAAEHIPPPLIEQLKNGGKMIIPVGSPFLNQNLVLVEKMDGKTTTKSLMPVRFVPFTRAE